jgi:hypothetical protein
MNEIVFTLMPGMENIPKDYYPVPGVKAVPDWYKNMKTSFNEGKVDSFLVSESQTMKRCMPILDAITTGYVIKTHTDIYIDNTDGKLDFKWANDVTPTVTFHGAYQVTGYINMQMSNGAPKMSNPWAIKTPKGYSCLFINPMHRPPMGVRILEGIVDTDGYVTAVNFPFIVEDGFVGTIPAGTPIAQVIPFKRASFRIKFGGVKEQKEANKIVTLLRSTWINGYRNKWRANKDYL